MTLLSLIPLKAHHFKADVRGQTECGKPPVGRKPAKPEFLVKNAFNSKSRRSNYIWR